MFNSSSNNNTQVSIWDHIFFSLDITTLISFSVLVLNIFLHQPVPNYKLAAFILLAGAALLALFSINKWIKVGIALGTLSTFVGYNFGFGQTQSIFITLELAALIICLSVARGFIASNSGNNLLKMFNPIVIAGIATQTLSVFSRQLDGHMSFETAIVLVVLIPFVNSLSIILSIVFTFFSLYFFIWKESGGNFELMKINFIYFCFLLLMLVVYSIIFLMFRKR